VKDGEREKIPAGTPPKLASLIARCWAHKVADRPASVKVVLAELMKEAVGGGAGVAASR